MYNFIWRKKYGTISITISVFLQVVPYDILFYFYYPYLIIWFHVEGTSYFFDEFPLVPYCFHSWRISIPTCLSGNAGRRETLVVSLIFCNRENNSRTMRIGFSWVVPVIGFPGNTLELGMGKWLVIYSMKIVRLKFKVKAYSTSITYSTRDLTLSN